MSTLSSPSVSTSRGLLRRMEEETKTSNWQGIGSILGSETERPKTGASLRRTLSADMSSKKWLKKIPSSGSFPVPSDSSYSSSSSSSSEGEEDEEQKEEGLQRPGLSDIWGSILSQKKGDSLNSLSTPYIHPLVKRSKSSLSQKSLEICTESLGSETGSEGFSSYPPLETSDLEDKSVEEQQSAKETKELPSQAANLVKEKEELGAAANNYYFATTRKSPPRSFPPPLPSLSQREGSSFFMQSHRREGRLVLEAVSVSSYNYFHAERQDGRLRLSFMNKASAELMETNNEEEEEEQELEDEEVGNEVEADVFDEFQGYEEEDEIEKVKRENNGIQVRGIVIEMVKGSQPTTRSTALLTNKVIGMTNKNPTWSYSHKKNVHLVEEEEEEVEEDLAQLPRSLPCPPKVARLMRTPLATTAAAAASFNAYDYFWRTKSATHPLIQQQQQPPSPPPIEDNNNYYSYCYTNKQKIISCSNKIVISNSKGMITCV